MLVIYVLAAAEEEKKFTRSPLAEAYQQYRARTGLLFPNPLKWYSTEKIVETPGKPMRLAWYNITHDRMRFTVTVLGITCAVFLMIFQGSILLGFLRAASKIIDSTGADLWITGRGVQCFEFAVPIERRFADLARGVPGVSGTSRICYQPGTVP